MYFAAIIETIHMESFGNKRYKVQYSLPNGVPNMYFITERHFPDICFKYKEMIFGTVKLLNCINPFCFKLYVVTDEGK